ncbi:hypothetical protein LPTSP4_23350 [Leptospira ryugenii]|uniref:VWA domain-containing protein n=1 Tax=Leptospira ryugenii TaxID=1917863 RepID=A0A2P2E1N9_9LEPT|nr:VWA domain-containing protein [Leptospira ryugenii]GBF50808.1 hypothetical protein LPTSP4_23350 [Leptospira ryugenii]
MSLVEDWQKEWQNALMIWSAYVKLSDPKFLVTAEDQEKEGNFDSFAAIRLADHQVILSVEKIKAFHLESYPIEILAHEIGHHVYCPGDLTDHGKILYILRSTLTRHEYLAPMLANIYEDLFINDKLKRQHNLRMEEVYQKVGKQDDAFWNFYMRTYELLWALPRQTLTVGQLEGNIESDAILVNRIVRNYSNDWVRAAFDFGNICFPYFFQQDSQKSLQLIATFHDTKDIGKGSEMPSGIMNVKLESVFEDLGEKQSSEKDKSIFPENVESLSPSNYSSIGEALGIKASLSDFAYRYYKEKALSYLVRFPSTLQPGGPERILEGTDVWEVGSPMERINIFESIMRGGKHIIPGYTAMENFYGEMPSYEEIKEPIDLDIFVDCSGSMPNPQTDVSFLTLAGAIITLSALRAGSKVRSTLWSGLNEYYTTKSFTRNEKEIMEVLTGYIGGGTCFPLDLLKEQYEEPKKRKVHILIISDEGIDTMYNQDYNENTRNFVKRMLMNAGGGGTMVLNLYSPTFRSEIQEMNDSGWSIFRISTWEELISFSRDFVKRTYERNQILYKKN